MPAWKALLALAVMAVPPSCCSIVTDLPGGGHVEVETGSRGQVCMYITDDWGAVESTQCTSSPGTYTLTGRGGGQARITVSAYGGVSVKTGYFQGGQSGTLGAGQQRQPSEEEENNVRFGAYENPRPPPPPASYPEATPLRAPPAQATRRMAYRRPSPPLRRHRPAATPTLPPVRVPHIARTVRPTFGPLPLLHGPPATEGDLGAVEIIASGPGQLTVFGNTDSFDSDSDGAEVTGPSAQYRTPDPLMARKKRNRLSAKSSSDGESVRARVGGGTFITARTDDSSTALYKDEDGRRLASVQSGDGSSVLSSRQDGASLQSVRAAGGGSALASRTAAGQRLGLVRSPNGSLAFSTFIDGRLVNVVRSADGSSVVSTSLAGRQVTALTSPAGQRLIAGAGPGHNLDAFFDQLTLRLGAL